MLAAGVLVTFLIYNLLLFCCQQVWLLLLLSGLTFGLICLVTRGHFRLTRRWLLLSLGLVFFVMLCNLPFLGPEKVNVIGLRLLNSLLAVILLTHLLSLQQFAVGLSKLFAPLRLFRVDTRALTLSIVLALNFIPILMREARTIESALRLKGLKFNLKNLLTRPQVFMTTYFRAVFARAEDMTQGLLLKGYE